MNEICDRFLKDEKSFVCSIEIRSIPESPRHSYINIMDASVIEACRPNLKRNGTVESTSHVSFFRSDGQRLLLDNLFSQQAVFIVCNGPSFRHLDSTKLKRPGILTFGMNNGAHLFRPNLWACVDAPQKFMKSIWSDPTLLKFLPVSSFPQAIFDSDLGHFQKSMLETVRMFWAFAGMSVFVHPIGCTKPRSTGETVKICPA